MVTVAAFWGDRPATRSEVADGLARFMGSLEAVDPVLTAWRRKAGSRKAAEAGAIIDHQPDSLAPLLSTQMKCEGNQVMTELGYSFSAWNGDDASISCTVGLHASNPGLRNSVVLGAPSRWSMTSPELSAVRDLLLAVWDPDEVWCFDHSEGSRELLWSARPLPD
jgi:hypothetical protein